MIKYEEPLFRPPAESESLIFQITLGCSWNKCAFCEMYSRKTFKARNIDDIIEEIEWASVQYSNQIRKIFLADGNAMCLSYSKLVQILDKINEKFPHLMRVSAYALPNDILSKTNEELINLQEKGLKLLYIGAESGNDLLLKTINKSETSDSTAQGIIKAQKAGIDCSVMIINGLGGKKYNKEHAEASADLINKTQPKFLSTLVLSLPFGEDKINKSFQGEYIPMTYIELLKEMQIFISRLELSGTIFRSDHASNFLSLKGVLGKDKQKMLSQISQALEYLKDKDKIREYKGIL